MKRVGDKRFRAEWFSRKPNENEDLASVPMDGQDEFESKEEAAKVALENCADPYYAWVVEEEVQLYSMFTEWVEVDRYSANSIID